jgi:ribosomal-protein-alanine N-acetyltransferase
VNIELRPAAAGDLDAILALERSIREAPHWPPARYAEIPGSQAPPRCLFVAVTEAGVAGFAVGLAPDADGNAELESVAVAASARRAGIGRALCSAVLDWCRLRGATSMSLEVRASSEGAIHLYTVLGFAVVARRSGYYADPQDDALLMRIEPS